MITPRELLDCLKVMTLSEREEFRKSVLSPLSGEPGPLSMWGAEAHRQIMARMTPEERLQLQMASYC